MPLFSQCKVCGQVGGQTGLNRLRYISTCSYWHRPAVAPVEQSQFDSHMLLYCMLIMFFSRRLAVQGVFFFLTIQINPLTGDGQAQDIFNQKAEIHKSLASFIFNLAFNNRIIFNNFCNMHLFILFISALTFCISYYPMFFFFCTFGFIFTFILNISNDHSPPDYTV